MSNYYFFLKIQLIVISILLSCVVGDKSDFILVRGGTFIMGDYSGTLYEEAMALPAHEVTISDYYLCRYLASNQDVVEVYNWALKKGLIKVTKDSVNLSIGKNVLLLNLAGLDESKYFPPQIGFDGNKLFVKDSKENYPTVFITWYGASAYCNFRSEIEGLEKCFNFSTWDCDFSKNGYRLPTEAEYEYAARNRGKEIRYPWGNGTPFFNSRPAANLPDSTGEKYFSKLHQWWRPEVPLPWAKYDDGYATTSPVSSMAPNPLGIHDIAGNAWEWIYDWFGEYSSEKQINPTGPQNGLKRCMRGGGWWNPDPYITCCARRDFDLPSFAYNHTGFRICHKK